MHDSNTTPSNQLLATGQALGGQGWVKPTATQTESERAEPASAIDTVHFVRRTNHVSLHDYTLFHV